MHALARAIILPRAHETSSRSRARTRARVASTASPSASFALETKSFNVGFRDETVRKSVGSGRVRRSKMRTRGTIIHASSGTATEPAAALLVMIPLALFYSALTLSAACNAFMWTLDLQNPIISSGTSLVLGRLCVAVGATVLACLNFFPQATKQLSRAHRAFTSVSSSERLKLDAAKFAALVVMKMMFEFYAYWKALTSFTPCSESLELCAWYGAAFVGHAAFMGLARVVIAPDATSTTEVPANARKLIGSFDLVLALMCFATSRLAMGGNGIVSAFMGAGFLIAALYFTFEDKLPKKSDNAQSAPA